jgi:peptide/nickel transport system permease protein
MYKVYTYKSNWWGFIGKRALIAVAAFFVITFLVFGLNIYNSINSPLSPFAAPLHAWYSTSPVPPEIIKELRRKYYLDGPYIVEYFRWLGDFITGNWGDSYIYGLPVKDLVF